MPGKKDNSLQAVRTRLLLAGGGEWDNSLYAVMTRVRQAAGASEIIRSIQWTRLSQAGN